MYDKITWCYTLFSTALLVVKTWYFITIMSAIGNKA